MHNNIFQFGTTWWKQNIGTAMGTPCACIHATLFFAYFEQTYLLIKYNQNILFYVRQIDDILMIWQDNDNDTNNHTFNQFKEDLNSQSKLKWKTQNPSHTTNFLDLTISIDRRGYISTKTFQNQ